MQNRHARKLIETAYSVLSQLDVDEILERVLRAAQELTGARYAAMGILNESHDGLARFLTVGIDEPTRREIGDLPRGHGVLGELIRDPKPLRLADVGAHPHSYGFPVGHPPMRTFLGVPVVVGDEAFGALYLTEKEGGEFDSEDEEAVLVLADFAAIAVANARAYGGARGRRDELERSVAALEATTEIARAVAGETDLAIILELIAKRGRALVSARTLAILLHEHGQLRVAAVAGEQAGRLMGQNFPLEGTVAGQVLLSARPQAVFDELGQARFQQHLARLDVEAQAGLFVPLRFRHRSEGVLVALDRASDGPGFSSEDQRLLEAFATSAATAVATAQTVASERLRHRLAAAEDERGRWARELHDDTLQSLGVLKLRLASARRLGSTAALRSAIDDASARLASEIDNLRGLIAELRPAALDELGTEAAIEALAERIGRSGLEVEVQLDLAYEGNRAATRHTPELEAAMYRIVQEALTNVVKHAEVERAVVTVGEVGDHVELRVHDDGRGFDPSAPGAGFGLLGMHERIDLLGGDFDVASEAGRGTTITVRLPVARAPAGTASAASAPHRAQSG